MMQPCMMVRTDLWPALGLGPSGFGAGPGTQWPLHATGPRLDGGLGGFAPLRMRPGMPLSPLPPGTSQQTADAVRLKFAAFDAMAVLTDPLTRKEREEVEEAIAMEGARQLWARVFGPEPGARKETPTIGSVGLDWGSYGGALGFDDSPSLPSAPSAMLAPEDSGAGLGAPPAADGADIAEAARRTFMKLTGTPPLPATDIPSITEAAAKALGDAPGAPAVQPPVRPSADVRGAELAANSPRWRVDAPAPYDALNAKWEAMLANFAQGYPRTADAAFSRGLGWSDTTDAALLRQTDAREAVREMEQAAVETAYKSKSASKITRFVLPDTVIRNDPKGCGCFECDRAHQDGSGYEHRGIDIGFSPGTNFRVPITGLVAHVGTGLPPISGPALKLEFGAG